MSKKTHRWRSRESLKLNKKYRAGDRDPKLYSSENCLINVQFENSPYFQDANLPFGFIFRGSMSGSGMTNETEAHGSEELDFQNETDKLDIGKITSVYDEDEEALNRVSGEPKINTKLISKHTFSSVLSIDDKRASNPLSPTEHHFEVYQKIYANEYLEAKSMQDCIHMQVQRMRCIFLSTDQQNIAEMLQVLEEFKNYLTKVEWESFRIIVIGEGFDVAKCVLNRQSHVDATPPPRVGFGEYDPGDSTLKMKGTEKLTFDDDDDENADEENQEFQWPVNADDEEDEDDDEAERLLGVAAAGKFRDSRVIRTKPPVPLTKESTGGAQDVSHHIKQIAKAFDSNLGVAKHTADEIRAEVEELSNLLNSIE